MKRNISCSVWLMQINIINVAIFRRYMYTVVAVTNDFAPARQKKSSVTERHWSRGCVLR